MTQSGVAGHGREFLNNTFDRANLSCNAAFSVWVKENIYIGISHIELLIGWDLMSRSFEGVQNPNGSMW